MPATQASAPAYEAEIGRLVDCIFRPILMAWTYLTRENSGPLEERNIHINLGSTGRDCAYPGANVYGEAAQWNETKTRCA